MQLDFVNLPSLKQFIVYLFLAFGLFTQTDVLGAKAKQLPKKSQVAAKSSKTSNKSKKPTSKGKKKKSTSKYSKGKKKSSKYKKPNVKIAPVVRTAQWAMIAQNKGIGRRRRA